LGCLPHTEKSPFRSAITDHTTHKGWATTTTAVALFVTLSFAITEKKCPPPRWNLRAIVRAFSSFLCLNPLMNARSGILVAEDDAMYALLLDGAISKVGFPLKTHFVQDGQQAVDYLEGAEKYSDREKHPLPCMLLLDLKMPFLIRLEVCP
jgi:hypothetical protein